MFLKRIRLLPLVISTLPIGLLIFWFIWGSLQDFYNRELRMIQPDTIGIDWFLQQKAHALRDGFTLKDISGQSQLRTFYIQIDRHLLDSLMTDLPASIQKYQKGWLVERNKYIPVKIRHRGATAHHWFNQKKSLKLKLPKNYLLKKSRFLNLLVPKWRLYIDYPLTMKICELVGCLHPDVEPVRVFINNDFYGYYFWKEEIDESWLRVHGFMVGNLYEGENFAQHYLSGIPQHLFLYPVQWQKTAVFNRRAESDTRGLKKLISMINTPEQRIHLHRAHDYRNILDLEQWHRFSAAITLLGSYHHDNRHNWMIFFDPFSAKLSPILHDPFSRLYTKNDVDIYSGSLMLAFYLQNPLNIFEKDQLVWAFLQTKTDSIFNYIKYLDSILVPEFQADRFKNHGTVDDFHARTQEILSDLGARFDFLKERLRNCRIAFKFQSDRLIVKSFGHSPAILKELNISRKDGQSLSYSEIKSLRLWRDINLNNRLDASDESVSGAITLEKGIARLEINDYLYPGRTEPDFNDDYLQRALDPAPLSYTYFVNSPKNTKLTFALRLENGLTGESVVVEEAYFPAGSAFSIHPWQLKKKHPQTVVWQDTIKLTENTIIPAHQTLIIKAGTHVLMDEKISFTAFGRCLIKGTKNAPIRFIPAEKEKTWGAFAIVGCGADSSRIKFAEFSYGTGDDRGLLAFTGMVQVHGAKNVIFENCRFSNNFYEDDTFHGVYCDVALVNCRFENAASDAIDFDYCSGKIVNCTFKYSGNDGIDLMTSSTIVQNNRIYNCDDKGISVGEDSKPLIIDNHLVNNNIGIEVKDHSLAFIERNLILDNKIGINAYQKNWRYGIGGFAQIKHCILQNNSVDFTLDKKSYIKVDSTILSTETKLPAPSNADSIGFHIDSTSTAKALDFSSWVKSEVNRGSRERDFVEKDKSELPKEYELK